MATRADTTYDAIEAALKEGDLLPLSDYLAAFYRRIHRYGVPPRILATKCDSDYSVIITLQVGQPPLQHRIEYYNSSRFYLDQRHCSDAEVAETLGIPMSYLEGLIDMIVAVAELNHSAKKTQAKNERERNRLDELNEKTTREVIESHEYAALAARIRSEVAAEHTAENNRLRAEFAQLRAANAAACLSVPECLLNIPDLELVSPFEKAKEGVYFLCDGSAVVYVGQSVSVVGRVAQHRIGKDFTHAFYMSCSRNRLDELEREWINRLLPKYNQDTETQGAKRRAAKKEGK